MEITNEMICQKIDAFEKRTDMQIEMLATLLKDFKAEANRRFEQIEAQQVEDHRILMNLWEHKDHMKLDLTRTLLTVTGTLSCVVAFIVSFITGKAIIYKG